MLFLRDLPRYETLLGYARRYPDVDPSAVESFLYLLRIAGDVLDATEIHLSRHGISQGRFAVLAQLNRNPEAILNPAELAHRVGVTRATMTGLLDGLERDGLVKREASQQDRRMQMVKLTGKGQSFIDRIMPDHFRRIASLMVCLDSSERRLLIQLLHKIQNNIPAMLAG